MLNREHPTGVEYAEYLEIVAEYYQLPVYEGEEVISMASATMDMPTDADMDGLADAVDPDQGGTPHALPDTDGDMAFDFQDVDSDGDTVPDAIEAHVAAVGRALDAPPPAEAIERNYARAQDFLDLEGRLVSAIDAALDDAGS